MGRGNYSCLCDLSSHFSPRVKKRIPLMKPITWSLTVWGFRTCQVSTREFRESRRHYYSILKLQKLSTLKTCLSTLPLWFIMIRERRWSSRVFYRVLVENTSQLKQCPYILSCMDTPSTACSPPSPTQIFSPNNPPIFFHITVFYYPFQL